MLSITQRRLILDKEYELNDAKAMIESCKEELNELVQDFNKSLESDNQKQMEYFAVCIRGRLQTIQTMKTKTRKLKKELAQYLNL